MVARTTVAVLGLADYRQTRAQLSDVKHRRARSTPDASALYYDCTKLATAWLLSEKVLSVVALAWRGRAL